MPLKVNFEDSFEVVDSGLGWHALGAMADMHMYLIDMDGIWWLCLVKDFSELINFLLNILANQINIVLIKIQTIEGRPKLCPLP